MSWNFGLNPTTGLAWPTRDCECVLDTEFSCDHGYENIQGSWVMLLSFEARDRD